ncbi:hypothetical protein Pfo_010236 [Paulownia fortunei]|nr:hypothetical protein Pfo_010236 [Paulownia fortunei]
MLMGMKGFRKGYSLSDFTKCLRKTDLFSKKCDNGWLFWSPMREELSENEVNSNSSLQEKIKLCMSQITIELFWEDSDSLVQFWAPKMNEDSHRCYLATSGQSFTLDCLHKGLALFRKQCMEHHYFVDEGAKEEELGPPGRVFRNGHFEFTHDVRLYSAREFPLRNQAARCFLRNYLALPVFDLPQHNCVGVLEAAFLSSTHADLQPSFRQNAAECQKQALTEIMEALELVTMIPQLYLAEVWVPCSQCISNNVSCVELALSTYDEWEFLRSMYKFNHVQTGKGIVGMLLASENKSCFCRNSCDFSIAEEPLAHYAQVVRLDVCFAICLQSSHTGNLLYVLKFFLNQGPGKHEYLPSFLNSLLQIMKQQLKSFKVACGQQLGEELVVEPDIFPIKFKNVQYSQKKHQHSKDQQLHFVPNDMDSVRSVVARANLKKQDATKKTEGGKRKTSLHLSREVLEPHFGKKLKDAAKDLHEKLMLIKRACRDCGIHRWPCDRKYKNNPSLFQTESGNQHVQDSQQSMCPSNSSNLPPSDMPLHKNVPHTNTESTQHLTVQPEVDMVIIKAKYEEDTIKFGFCRSSGMNKLVKEVAKRHDLTIGSFKLKYLDEDNDQILLASDDDLQFCLKTMTAVGQTSIRVFVHSIPK